MTLVIKKPTGSKLVLSKIQQYPAVLGEPWGGGYFAGYISHTADGNPTHSLIVAPRAVGQVSMAFASNANAPDGVNYSTTSVGGQFTGTISGTTMTVTAVSSGKIRPGHTIAGTGLATGTTVVNQVSGTPTGIGDYVVSISQTITSRTLTMGTSSFDGAANATLLKNIDGTIGSGSTLFPAANFCATLSIGGYSDWYHPSIIEFDILYFNLKPTTNLNFTGAGINAFSVPRRDIGYITTYPQQTFVSAFTTNAESFLAQDNNTSTEISGSLLGIINLNNGRPFQVAKSAAQPIRAIRRIALP